MIQVTIADKEQHIDPIRELFWEYLQWANARLNQEYNINFDIAATIEDDMKTLDKFMPPRGRLLLANVDEHPAGVACMKELTADIGEIKRMYVREQYRGKGVGRDLIDFLVREAPGIGYTRIRLDSNRFMADAHRLYKRAGFKEIEAYEGSEIPKEFQEHWIFMESDVSKPRN